MWMRLKVSQLVYGEHWTSSSPRLRISLPASTSVPLPHFFVEHRGGFFVELIKHTEKYVYPRPVLHSWLEKIRSDGTQRVFLATNSYGRFAALLLEFMFGPSWRRLFGAVFVNCKKSGWFSGVQPLYHVSANGVREGEVATELQVSESGVFYTGSAFLLQALADTIHHGRKPVEEVVLSLDVRGHVVAGNVCPPVGMSGLGSPLSYPHSSAVSPSASALPADTASRCDARSDVGTAAEVAALHNAERVHSVAEGMMDAMDIEGGEVGGVPDGADSSRHVRIVYVGDHLHGDIAAAHDWCHWHTISVVEELEWSAPPPAHLPPSAVVVPVTIPIPDVVTAIVGVCGEGAASAGSAATKGSSTVISPSLVAAAAMNAGGVPRFGSAWGGDWFHPSVNMTGEEGSVGLGGAASETAEARAVARTGAGAGPGAEMGAEVDVEEAQSARFVPYFGALLNRVSSASVPDAALIPLYLP
jgi:hypothetical protein